MQLEFLKLISQGGMVSILVAVILLTMSIGSWTLMIIKAIQTRLIKRKNNLFVKGLSPVEHQAGALWKQPKNSYSGTFLNPENIRHKLSVIINDQPEQMSTPYVRLAFSGFNAFDQLPPSSKESPESMRTRDEFIAQSLRRTIGNEALRLETGLTILATIGSLSPFVGLFGTVWGIYHALAAIAAGGQATVDKVAGPVGEALIMTAFGLAVAMPAVLAYNGFIRDNRLLMTEIENFAHDLYASLTLGSTQMEKPAVKAVTGKQTMAVVS